MQDIDAFTQGYIDAALWTSCDPFDIPLDKGYDRDNLTPGAIAEIVRECRDFQHDNQTKLELYSSLSDRPIDHAGHDFWLTRNHHGAGFWDRDLGSLGDALTDAAHAYTECSLYVSDGKVHYFNR